MPKIVRALPAQPYLRECLSYNRRTGALRWRRRPRTHFSSDKEWRRFNTRYAHEIARRGQHRFGHIIIRLDREEWLAHRLIWKLVTGEDVSEIDHRNRIPDDNRFRNLRPSNSAGQTRNRSRQKTRRAHNLPKGVIYQPSNSRRFGARICVDGKKIWLGTFDTPDKAHAAYCVAAKRHFGEFWCAG